MLTPVLTYYKDRQDKYDTAIANNVATVKSCIPLGEDIKDSIDKLLRNLCYKLFSLSPAGGFENGGNYTIADLCENIKGIFRTNMVKYAHNMVEGNIEPLLTDAFSYELLVMLNRNVVDIYACMLYYHGLLNNDSDLCAVAKQFLYNPTGRPTLDWEAMYLALTK